jgi:anti-sigma factor ChrR (cupin superfamily)
MKFDDTSGDHEQDDDAFLRDLALTDAAGAKLIPAALEASELDASAAVRGRVLAALDPYERFARFESAVAELLDVSRKQARIALTRIDDPAAWVEVGPGMAYQPLECGPGASFTIAGFIRVDAGLDTPEHEHLGEEVTLVLQGCFADSSGARFYAGEPARQAKGTRHSFSVPADGPHLVGLAAVETGVKLIEPG